VARVIHVSAIGAMPESTSEFHRAKGQAEISVQSSGTAWTIVRPSLLLGTGGIDLDRCFLPLTGGHLAPRTRSVSHRFQPIGVEDVAHGLVNALERSQTEGLACEAGGVDVLTLGEMLELRGAARGLSVRFVRVPPSVTRISGLGKTLPKLQTLMRARARCDDPEPFWLAFGVTPKPASVLLREIESASELRGD
jgi:NADH dehydrogenase